MNNVIITFITWIIKVADWPDILVTNNLVINGYEYDNIESAHMRACSFVVL